MSTVPFSRLKRGGGKMSPLSGDQTGQNVPLGTTGPRDKLSRGLTRNGAMKRDILSRLNGPVYSSEGSRPAASLSLLFFASLHAFGLELAPRPDKSRTQRACQAQPIQARGRFGHRQRETSKRMSRSACAGWCLRRVAIADSGPHNSRNPSRRGRIRPLCTLAHRPARHRTVASATCKVLSRAPRVYNHRLRKA